MYWLMLIGGSLIIISGLMLSVLQPFFLLFVAFGVLLVVNAKKYKNKALGDPEAIPADGEKLVFLPGLILRRDLEGFYRIGLAKKPDEARYYLREFKWDGPLYNEIRTTVTTGKDKSSGNAGKTLAGAAVGSLALGPVGAVVGGLAGASGKRKTKVNRKETTKTKQKEVPASGYLTMINADTGEMIVKVLSCTSKTVKAVFALSFRETL